MTKGR